MTIPTELIELGLLANTLKERILQLRGASFCKIREVLETAIKEKFLVLFPVNIAPGYILGHDTPLSDDQRNLGDQDFTTIDFGIKGSKYMIDTAITLVKPESEPILANYREAMNRTIEAIRQEYRKQTRIKIKQITRIVQECFAHFTIVEECCAHQIKGDELYHRIIPMGAIKFGSRDAQDFILAGDTITIEPHVSLRADYRLEGAPGKIRKEGSLYVSTEFGAGEIDILLLRDYGFYQEHVLFFGGIQTGYRVERVT